MKTGMHDQESPREHQGEAQCVLMPQIEANVCRHKCNLLLNLMVLLCFHSYTTRTIVINCFVLIFTFCLGNLKNQKVSETKEKMKR